ncbi:MAG: uracil-DNA glycosylase [Clostridia bacterium]|nr:uracil-DNA glycosylase [Clostridia bacterium]
MELNWNDLKQRCLTCRACGLCETRHQVVFGVGNPQAEVLFIGEGPGENEDLQGEPFVGRAGKLLDTMLEAVGLSRKHNIYIGNMVKCRPPHNRDPLPEEQAACAHWLEEQIALISPKIVVCLGRIAAFRFISPDFKVSRQHGEFFEKDGVLYMGMFHPAAILRNPNQKPVAFVDFVKLRDKIQEICTHTELKFDE